jgi:hypothetical protein
MKLSEYHWFDAVAFIACLLVVLGQSVLLRLV